MGVNGVSDADAKNRKMSSEVFSPVSSSKETVTTEWASEKRQLRDGKTQFALVVSHPIQHFTPFYRALAQCEGITLKVFFCCRVGLEPYFDREMNTHIAWNINLLSGAMTTCSCQKPRGSRVRGRSKSAIRVLARSLRSSTPKSC